MGDQLSSRFVMERYAAPETVNGLPTDWLAWSRTDAGTYIAGLCDLVLLSRTDIKDECGVTELQDSGLRLHEAARHMRTRERPSDTE